MAEISKFRGYEMEEIDNEWFFCESRDPVKETWKKLVCGYCGDKNTKDGHDGCMGNLPGTMNACCGHGQLDEAYIQFLDATIIKGKSAKIIMAELKKYNGEKMKRSTSVTIQ